MRCRTGWPPIISSSWASRRRCSTAGSGCSPSATCASRGSGRSRCSSDSATTRSRSRSTATARGPSSKPGRRATPTAASRSRCGTARSTNRRRTVTRLLDRSVTVAVDGLRGRGLRGPPPPGRRDPFQHPRDMGSAWPARLAGSGRLGAASRGGPSRQARAVPGGRRRGRPDRAVLRPADAIHVTDRAGPHRPAEPACHGRVTPRP